ncbi:MAG: primosomal replication protein PriC [Psychromonas sp.]
MAELDKTSILQLKTQLSSLKARCIKIDKMLTQTENRCFVFEVHQFSTRSLTLLGYFQQIEKTFNSLQSSMHNNRQALLIKIECEQFVMQFQLLQQLVQSIEKGKASLLYKSYSAPKEKIFQQLKKQSEYEHRLLTMIAEQEELLAQDGQRNRAYIKEKIEALKIRFHKCNTFTQKLEFQLEEINDE